MLFPGLLTSLSQIVKPLLNSSNDFSPLGNSFQRPSFLRTSSWLSSTLFSSLFSSQLLWARVGSPRLSSTCPIFSQPCRSDAVANFLVQASWIAFPFDVVSAFDLCYHSRVMCYHSILLDCWLLPVGPTFKHAWAAAFFPCARRAVTSRAAICQERTQAAQPQAPFSPAAWKAKRTRTRKLHSCACHRNAARRGKRRQHSRALFFSPSKTK